MGYRTGARQSPTLAHAAGRIYHDVRYAGMHRVVVETRTGGSRIRTSTRFRDLSRDNIAAERGRDSAALWMARRRAKPRATSPRRSLLCCRLHGWTGAGFADAGHVAELRRNSGASSPGVSSDSLGLDHVLALGPAAFPAGAACTICHDECRAPCRAPRRRPAHLDDHDGAAAASASISGDARPADGGCRGPSRRSAGRPQPAPSSAAAAAAMTRTDGVPGRIDVRQQAPRHPTLGDRCARTPVARRGVRQIRKGPVDRDRPPSRVSPSSAVADARSPRRPEMPATIRVECRRRPPRPAERLPAGVPATTRPGAATRAAASSTRPQRQRARLDGGHDRRRRSPRPIPASRRRRCTAGPRRPRSASTAPARDTAGDLRPRPPSPARRSRSRRRSRATAAADSARLAERRRQLAGQRRHPDVRGHDGGAPAAIAAANGGRSRARSTATDVDGRQRQVRVDRRRAVAREVLRARGHARVLQAATRPRRRAGPRAPGRRRSCAYR